MVDLAGPVSQPGNSDDVESISLARAPVTIDPRLGDPPDFSLLVPGDRLERAPELVGQPGFHLNERHHVAFAGHEVYLEPAHAEPMNQDPPSGTLEKSFGRGFPRSTFAVADIFPLSGVGSKRHGGKVGRSNGGT
jgi:hypothetical protein